MDGRWKHKRHADQQDDQRTKANGNFPNHVRTRFFQACRCLRTSRPSLQALQ
jgi:hypothetical protein